LFVEDVLSSWLGVERVVGDEERLSHDIKLLSHGSIAREEKLGPSGRGITAPAISICLVVPSRTGLLGN
jgi:hypothetical protein